jgi:hypothetical protein
VLAADGRITWWARQLAAAGVTGGMDVLRARAALDLLLNCDSRPAAFRGTAPAEDGRITWTAGAGPKGIDREPGIKRR